MKKIISLILALVMVMGLAVTAFAETEESTGTITITPPDGVDSAATNTYKIYKVFDASGNGTSISYKVKESKAGQALPTGFVVDNAGNVHYGTIDSNGVVTKIDTLTAESISAITTYVTEADLVTTVTATGADNAIASGLANGYYYITTTLGSVVTIDSTNHNATVNDKNVVPTLDKKITGANSVDADGKKALAQIGTMVTYTATIKVGKGAKDLVFHDTMTEGLTFNKDVIITGIDAGQYTVKETPDTGDTFTITFKDGIEEGTEIIITYSATINELALTDNPENNTAYVSYGDPSSHNKTPESKTQVWNAQFTVTKKDGTGSALAGAGFVIKNSEGKYYKYTDAAKVEWVDTIDNATEKVSGENGAVDAFIGLANGTYTLVEKTVPAGYNRANDISFTIAEHDYTTANLEQSAEVTNNAGSELPSTGGIGTTLFYVIGGLLMAGAAVVLITKKRMT